jgi:thiamine pyrophosphate-dependent acetolactate synthase large subunit-like protein
MVVISGNIQSYFFGRHAHQETNLHGDANQADSLAPFTKRIWRVTRPEALVPALDAAFRLAESGRKGPVLVDVAMDVFSDTVEMAQPYVPTPPRRRRRSVNPARARSRRCCAKRSGPCCIWALAPPPSLGLVRHCS